MIVDKKKYVGYIIVSTKSYFDGELILYENKEGFYFYFYIVNLNAFL